MARLSAQHHKDAAATPKTERKSSRFRDMFMQRTSSSASSSPMNLEKSSPGNSSSPLPSPIVRPGFKQIGLLPSERELDISGGARADEMRKSLQQSFQDALSKHENENEESAVDMTEGLRSPFFNPDSQNIIDTFLTSPSNSFGTFFHGKTLSSTRTVNSADRIIARDNESGKGAFNELSTDQYKGHRIEATSDFLKSNRMSHHIPQPMASITAADPDTTLVSEDDGRGRRRSHASNIFDDDSSLSQGIREYVASKIAEALVKQDKKHLGRVQATAVAPVQVTINIDVTGLAKTGVHNDVEKDATKMLLLSGSKTAGSLTITHPRIATDVQLGVIAIYTILLLRATFLGPKALLLTLWRMAVILAVYTASLTHLGWSEHLRRDVLLAPVFYAGNGVQNMGGRLLNELRAMAVSILTEALQSMGKDVEVSVNDK
ncbi:hypothetical protein EJ02DRAFT_494906 [Clathrospora elynae]|uniref:Uncharacterized protein n=1 Tax=Clathrospora elynae TaxID=706981 RepID=A0A6A5STD7_9PLEO|nr:hypothetical protein EJ02DRAFT_494906 [Clathrospora elynae]